jgi:cytochrome c oxidase cbb3-type subunit III
MSDDIKNPINDPLTDHEYDGIQEYDNPLPTWWLWTFFLTIIFAFLYLIHYESGSGPTLKEELAVAMKNLEQAAAQHAPAVTETEDLLAEQMKNPKMLELGATTFANKCAACHAPQLGGLIGPNLTDNFWLHGKGTRMDIVGIIRKGVPDKGMPPWETMLSKDEVYGLAAYIISKKGSNPPNAKAPQGEEVK